MANCRKCGISIGMFSKDTIFEGCKIDEIEAQNTLRRTPTINFEKVQSHRTPDQIAAIQLKDAINKIMLTTETAPNINITERI